jgi:hypothetical protein
VKRGGDPSAIAFSFSGEGRARLEANGDIVVASASGDVVHRKPESYPVLEGRRVPVASAFRRTGSGAFGFEVGSFDPRFDLVIDPLTLVSSTFLGGSAEDRPLGICLDATGAAYVVGTTASIDFPASNGYDPPPGGGFDVFVAKINPDGASLAFSTFMGGRGNDLGWGVTLYPSGCIWVTGTTQSRTFPTVRAFDPTWNGDADVFVTKLGPSGRNLILSTFLGGRKEDIGDCLVFIKLRE